MGSIWFILGYHLGDENVADTSLLQSLRGLVPNADHPTTPDVHENMQTGEHVTNENILLLLKEQHNSFTCEHNSPNLRKQAYYDLF
jgi:hypothetical protein